MTVGRSVIYYVNTYVHLLVRGGLPFPEINQATEHCAIMDHVRLIFA